MSKFEKTKEKLFGRTIFVDIETTNTTNPTTAASTATPAEEINCYYCLAKNTVFSNEDGSLSCNNCNAQYFPVLLGGQKRELVAIQNWAIAHTDPAMGYVRVYGQRGDISKAHAESILQREYGLREGFRALSNDFMSLLWYSTGGTPKIDKEVIREACRKFAYDFTCSNFSDADIIPHDDELTMRMTFPAAIIKGIDSERLAETHRIISLIPKSNGNLIRYLIAEGQEKLILIAAQKTYDRYIQKYAAGKRYYRVGMEIAGAMCV